MQGDNLKQSETDFDLLRKHSLLGSFSNWKKKRITKHSKDVHIILINLIIYLFVVSFDYAETEQEIYTKRE